MTTSTAVPTLTYALGPATIRIANPSTVEPRRWAAHRELLTLIVDGKHITRLTGIDHERADPGQARPIWAELMVSLDLNGERIATLDQLQSIAGGQRAYIGEVVDETRKSAAQSTVMAMSGIVPAMWLRTAFDKNPPQETTDA